ncbi:hypothetical protein YPPY12_1760 [Yersinia pestis PY-12]|nr:hypothetical protein YPPY12_1760 [Yersinia pestis PY-12]
MIRVAMIAVPPMTTGTGVAAEDEKDGLILLGYPQSDAHNRFSAT